MKGNERNQRNSHERKSFFSRTSLLQRYDILVLFANSFVYLDAFGLQDLESWINVNTFNEPIHIEWKTAANKNFNTLKHFRFKFSCNAFAVSLLILSFDWGNKNFKNALVDLLAILLGSITFIVWYFFWTFSHRFQMSQQIKKSVYFISFFSLDFRNIYRPKIMLKKNIHSILIWLFLSKLNKRIHHHKTWWQPVYTRQRTNSFFISTSQFLWRKQKNSNKY